MNLFPYPLSFPLVMRGLLDSMDDGKPRGLFALFGDEAEEENTASPADDGIDRDAQARWAADPAFQDARLEELRRRLSASDPREWDPETRAFYRQLNAVGKGLSESTAEATSYGPWAVIGPGGSMRLGPRPGSGPTTTAPQSGPSFLVGAPQAKPAENRAYGVPRRDDAEAAPVPGPDFLFGGPQARTTEETQDQVYNLPPPEDWSYESSEEKAEKKAQEERAAEKSKENWEALCDKWLAQEEQRCGYKFSYGKDPYFRCLRQVNKRHSACLKNKDTYERQWTDDQEDGGFKPKTPYQKRLEKWKRPRTKPR